MCPSPPVDYCNVLHSRISKKTAYSSNRTAVVWLVSCSKIRDNISLALS